MSDEIQDDLEVGAIRARFKAICSVEALLGQGGMGAVFRGDRRGTPVALKVLLPHVLNDPSALRRFQMEGEILKTLDHPNVLKIYEVGVVTGWPYMLAELVDGGTVGDQLATGPRPWVDALAVCESVLEALVVVHDRKIYHRDIKPSNLLRNAQGQVKLADFGIAKAEAVATRKTSTGLILGTPAYIAPEVLKGRAADARSDVFSLGVVLYELLAGVLPWEVEDGVDLLTARFQRGVPRLSSRVSGVPRAFDGLVEGAMAAEPVDRYPSASTFLMALRKTRAQLEAVHSRGETRATWAGEVDPGPPPANRMTIATSARRSRPNVVIRPAAEKPAYSGTLAATLIAALGLVTVTGILLTRSRHIDLPAPAPQGETVGPPALSNEERQKTAKILPVLEEDPKSRIGVQGLDDLCRLPEDRAAATLYTIWTEGSHKVRPTVARRLMNFRNALCVPPLADFLVSEPLSSGDDARVLAARKLLEIVKTCASEDCPMRSSVWVKLGTVLQLTEAEGRGERWEVVQAAIRTIGWLEDRTTSDSVIDAMRRAPSRVGWLDTALGISPERELLDAFKKIGSKKAQAAYAELSAQFHAGAPKEFSTVRTRPAH